MYVMASTQELARIVEVADVLPSETVAEQLSYQRMLILADAYLGWATDKQTTPEQAAKLLGWARGLHQLARLKGEDWNPPEPEKISLIGFLARQMESMHG